MKHLTALIAALLIFAMTGCALARSFTPITVDGDNYLNNLDTCIASIGQITLNKDETFSFNRTVGARSEDRGYCQAQNGRGVEVVGGGVAQVATTIYLAVKNVESIEVVEKHTYGSDFCGKYVPDGEDAVLADYGQAVDFRMTNRGETVTIDLWRDEGKVYCSVNPAAEADEAADAEAEAAQEAPAENAEARTEGEEQQPVETADEDEPESADEDESETADEDEPETADEDAAAEDTQE